MSAVRVLLVLLLCAPELYSQARRQMKARPPAKASAVKPLAPELLQVKRWMSGMTARDRVAQLIVIPFYGDNPNARSKAYRKFAAQVRQLQVGGLILVNRVQNGSAQNAEPTTSAAFVNRMQKLARIPLIVGGDFERGASMRVSGMTKFPHNMAFAAAQDPEATRKLGAATAREARAIGAHWVFGPVADVNNNPDNPIINIRAYSEDPREVAEHVKAYIEGARSDPRNKVLLTVKHFPGHGDTAVDTHVGLGKLEASKERLSQLELVPFKAAIALGIDSVMTAHLWVPAIESREIPATVSAAVLTDLLKKELNFHGLVTTDAMDMEGLRSQYPAGEAAVRAIEAGADVLLMPANPERAVRALSEAVRSGRLKQARIDESVEKLLRAKVRLGLHKQRLVDLEAVTDEINLDEDNQLAQKVADKAVTLVRNEGELVPLANPGTVCWFALGESRYGQQGRQLLESVQQRWPRAKRLLMDPQMALVEMEEAAKSAASCETMVVAAFAGFRGNGTLADNYEALLNLLVASGKPVILVGLGNPYLVRSHPQVRVFLATFSTVPVSEIAAVKALAGEISIGGQLPVTIPGIAKYADGLKVAAKPSGNLTPGSFVR
ncbi:MAG TPA: glycoside hydrolase family 3 N-terminal domain-containing protein [Bryobacteraceae bacterium]|nr:glycoside hydrolase family 3 N-terminal domain-containing protein [Bryobacteraceae bacterium]